MCRIEALTDGILLLLGHQQFSSIAIPHSHPLTQRPQFTIILLIFPNLQERLAVLQLQVVILGQARVQLAIWTKRGYINIRLTLGTLPKEQRIQEHPRLPLT